MTLLCSENITRSLHIFVNIFTWILIILQVSKSQRRPQRQLRLRLSAFSLSLCSWANNAKAATTQCVWLIAGNLYYIDRQTQTQTQTQAPTVDGKKRQLTTSNNNNNKAKIIISIICSSIIIIFIIYSFSSIFSTNILWSSLNLFTSLDFWRCHLPFLLHFAVVVLVLGAQLVLVGIGRRGRTSSFLW